MIFNWNPDSGCFRSRDPVCPYINTHTCLQFAATDSLTCTSMRDECAHAHNCTHTIPPALRLGPSTACTGIQDAGRRRTSEPFSTASVKQKWKFVELVFREQVNAGLRGIPPLHVFEISNMKAEKYTSKHVGVLLRQAWKGENYCWWMSESRESWVLRYKTTLLVVLKAPLK
jgi:hypothetical protein